METWHNKKVMDMTGDELYDLIKTVIEFEKPYDSEQLNSMVQKRKP